MIKRDSEAYRIVQHLLNQGPLSAAEACQRFISNNLRSRVPELLEQGFDVESVPVEGKQYCKYLIPPDKLEKNRIHFSRSVR
ncbi:MAG: hypothetical protein GXP61_08135 [Epsilonproteobacteria bacterium]|nr:hypothetical protein [Campylobacterota bacterium]